MNWKQIPGYPGYEASDTGLIRSVDRTVVASNGIPRRLKGRVLVECRNGQGYRKVSLGADKQLAVHIAVARTWIGPINEGFEVNHKDGIKTNNHPDNLEIVTRGDNVRHAVATGLLTGKRGERNHFHKLTEAQVRMIRDSGRDALELAAELNVSRVSIYHARSGLTWGHLD